MNMQKWNDDVSDEMLFDPDYDDFMEWLFDIGVLSGEQDALNEVTAMFLFVCKQHASFQRRMLNKKSTVLQQALLKNMN